MRLSEIRGELLQQHAELRSRIAAMLIASHRWQEGAPREDLDRALGPLADALKQHNAREEDLLRNIISGIDAWGPARAEVMLEEHLKEREDLLHSLLETSRTRDPAVAGPALRELAARLLRHMDREESTFLGEDLLRDDLGPPTDYISG